MRRFIATFLVLSCLVSGAAAQEAADWTGFYAGVGISGAQASTSQSDIEVRNASAGTNILPDGAFYTLRYDPEAATGIDQLSGLSLSAGYGQQIGDAVLGIEASVDFFGTAEITGPHVPCAETFTYCAFSGFGAKVDRLGHVRGLVGVALDPKVMVFGTAGVSFANVTAHSLLYAKVGDFDQLVTDGDAQLVAGTTLGAGVDYRATDSLRIRVEGMIDSFAAASYDGVSDVSVTDGTYLAYADMDGGYTLHSSMVSARVSAFWDF